MKHRLAETLGQRVVARDSISDVHARARCRARLAVSKQISKVVRLAVLRRSLAISVEAVALEVVVLVIVVADNVLAHAQGVLAERKRGRIANLSLALIRIRWTEAVVRLPQEEPICSRQ